jgi:MFS family permease
MPVTPRPTAFHQSRPILITSLVNKSGSIGLSLLPMLLVEGRYSTAQSSLAMSLVKASIIAATLGAGALADAVGLRKTVLAAFALAALGLGLLPLQRGFHVLLAAGIVAQVGITAVNATMRLILTKTVERKHQKEALGWMRFVNNLGQILSFGLGMLTAALGTRLLIWFDALTSAAAFLLGWRILPQAGVPLPPGPLAQGAPIKGRGDAWWPFVGCTLVLFGWNFMYEFFMSGVAGRLKLVYPTEGLRIFSALMVVNTILCAGLAVAAARFLNRVVPSLVLGVVLTAGGLLLGVLPGGSVPLLFCGILLLTLGEIVYGALAQFLMIRAVPVSRRENTVYSTAILLSSVGKIAAGGSRSRSWSMPMTRRRRSG